MANQEFYSRIIHKHDTEVNWNTAAEKSNFIPKQGEIIVYDIDNNHDYERIKIGDGITNVKDLPFNMDQVSTILTDLGVITVSLDEVLENNQAIVVDADTLGGHAPNYYATKNDLDNLEIDSLSNLGITATATELNYTSGVTSNIQTQLNDKLSITGTATKAISDANGNNIFNTYATKSELPEVIENAIADIDNLVFIGTNDAEDTTSGVTSLIDADTLSGRAASYFAIQTDMDVVNTNITNIINGTTKVAKSTSADNATSANSATKAIQDGSGNIITDTYATKANINTTNTNITNIINGTTKVAKSTLSDNATKAIQDGSGNIITNTYATKAQLGTQATYTLSGTTLTITIL